MSGITPLPTPPTRADPTNFAARGDAFMAALPQFVEEANALGAAMGLVGPAPGPATFTALTVTGAIICPDEADGQNAFICFGAVDDGTGFAAIHPGAFNALNEGVQTMAWANWGFFACEENQRGIIGWHTTFAAGKKFEIVQAGNTPGGIGLTHFSTTPGVGPSIVLHRANDATIPALVDTNHTTVAAGDTLGSILAEGSDGSDASDEGWASSSQIIFEVDGVVATGVVPGRIVFRTASATGAVSERARIDALGAFSMTHRVNAPTANLGTGAYIYVESGAVKVRGGSGTVTVLAPA
jgi:hypothetical protein